MMDLCDGQDSALAVSLTLLRQIGTVLVRVSALPRCPMRQATEPCISYVLSGVVLLQEIFNA
jgi:hypothetical protein